MNRFITAIKAGNYRNAACAYAGIGETTLARWIEKGKAKNPPPEYEAFVKDLEQAELEAEAGAVLLWRVHMKDDYRACRDFLERRYPARWGRREHVVHEGGGVPVAVMNPDHALQKIVNDPETFKRYNDFLASLSKSYGPDSRESGSLP